MPTKAGSKSLVRSLKRAKPDVAARLKAQAGISVPVTAAPAPGVKKPRPAAAAQALAAAVPALKPGVERWAVKTGTDPTVNEVNLSAGVVSTTVDELVAAQRPGEMPDPTKEYPAFEAKRAAPVETTVWALDCEITAVKLEQDGDYHLVLRAPSGETMIGEIPDPDPAFVNPSSPFAPDIQTVRKVVEQKIFNKLLDTPLAPLGKYMVPASSFATAPAVTTTIRTARQNAGPSAAFVPFPVKASITPVKAHVTGVGFFDRKHGQLGVAPNAIEIHPVLDITIGGKP
jgi:hypothetical protein